MAYGRVLLALIALLSVFVRTEISAEINEIQKAESARIRDLFKETVGNREEIKLDGDYLQFVLSDAARIISPENPNESKYFVYVDRNPAKQLIFICFFDSFCKNVNIIGADIVSTGNPVRKGHFLTPVGVFENTVKNFGYRALGTKNDKGWKGLGEKGSRIWDFGWQKTEYKNGGKQIRLLIHATDPIYGEKRLGKRDSKGCIRISAKLNKFLDHYGVLDDDYEKNRNMKRASWLLRNDRKPIAFAGKYLIVGDSSATRPR